jgi:uncharacterized protein
MGRWEYRGRWALVTGASAGFGEEFARALAARGMHVILTARRRERLDALASELEEKHGVQAVVIPHDLGEPGAAQPLWEQATQGRTVHLLINNAGMGAHGPFHAVDRERHVAVGQLNCIAPLELMHLALAEMRKRREGGIINVGSTASFQPVPMVSAYGASKAFILSLSLAVWAENRGSGVRILALCPGRSPTEFQTAAGTNPVRKIPTLVLAPATIVEQGLRALEKDKPLTVPGAMNFLATFAGRVLPRGVLARTMYRINRYLI